MGEIKREYTQKAANETTLFKIVFRLDNKKILIEKQEFTLTDLLASIGGLGTAVEKLFKIITKLSAKQMFMSSILGQLFWIKMYKPKDVEDELKYDHDPKIMKKNQEATTHALKMESKHHRFCNVREKRDYLSLKRKLKVDNPVLQQSDLNNIVAHVLTHRVPYTNLFSLRTFVKFYVVGLLPCIKKRMKKGKDEDVKKINLFDNGVKRYYQELDVTSLIKAVRISKVLQWNMLH